MRVLSSALFLLSIASAPATISAVGPCDNAELCVCTVPIAADTPIESEPSCPEWITAMPNVGVTSCRPNGGAGHVLCTYNTDTTSITPVCELGSAGSYTSISVKDRASGNTLIAFDAENPPPECADEMPFTMAPTPVTVEDQPVPSSAMRASAIGLVSSFIAAAGALLLA